MQLPADLDEQRALFQALARLFRGHDGDRVLTWFVDNLATEDSGLRKLEGVILHKTQGRAQILDELITEIHNAPDSLDAINESERAQPNNVF